MRVRTIKDFHTAALPTVQILAGSYIETTEEIARAWIGQGYVVPDSVEVAVSQSVTETAVTNATNTADRKREQTRERVRRYREKQKSNANK